MFLTFRTLLISMLLTSTALADTWTVDDDGKADFDNIQAAVNAASDGDEIIVAPGTYTSTASEVVNIYFKGVWLHSSSGVEVTIIDGEETRRGIRCQIGETSNTIIEGFTITNGYADAGGGMSSVGYGGSPTLTNCTFENNTAVVNGGGVYINNSSPSLTSCTFTNNTALWGGGMYNHGNSETIVISCEFTNNTATNNGGGIFTWSPPTLTDTTVCGNTHDQIYGNWTDNGGNTVAAECPSCPDVNSDGIIDPNDILAIIWAWGTCNGCSEDLNDDGMVNLNDLMIVIDSWDMECL